MTNSLADLLLENIEPDEKSAPEQRIKDASTGRELFRSMLMADRSSAEQRVRQQAMLDGQPPWDQAALVATGQGSLTNLNWGDAENIVEFTKAGMIDLINSVERLVKVPLKPQYFEDQETRLQLEETLADEITKTFRRWEGFDFNYLNLIHHWLCFGVGITYWEDAMDWRWKTTGLSDFVIPRQTPASEDRITIAGCRRRYELHELYAKIRDEEKATKLGWNVAAVKQAMMRADSAYPTGSGWSDNQWERLQAQLKNNDLGAGVSGRTQTVEIIHLWVQEFDGTVSMYAVSDNALVDDGRGDPWLFEARHEYKEVRNAFNFFCYGIGTNGTYHSISGILRKIYPQVQVSNRLRSKMVDAAAISAGIMIQPLSETAYDRMNYVTQGPYTMLPAADVATFVQQQSPNIGNNVTPILADMERTINQRAGQFQGSSPFGGQAEKTRFQVQAEIESLSRVGASQLNLFYPAWGRHLKEAVRRLCRLNYSDAAPGGKEATDFRKRLEMRGFPLEVLKYIDFAAVTCEKAVGSGSFAQRTAMLLELTEVSGAYDEVGRHNLYRDRTAAALKSYELADRYIPRMPGDVRPPMDKKIAELENASMKNGDPINVEMNEKHVVHLDVHLPYLAQILQAVEQGQMDLMAALPITQMIYEHCNMHLEQIAPDVTIQDRVASYRQALQQAGEIIWNGQKKAMKMQRDAEMQAQEGGPEGQGQQQGEPIDAEMQRKLIEFQTKLQMTQQQSSVKQQIMLQEAAVKRQIEMEKAKQQAALKDATTAAEILSRQQQNLA